MKIEQFVKQKEQIKRLKSKYFDWAKREKEALLLVAGVDADDLQPGDWLTDVRGRVFQVENITPKRVYLKPYLNNPYDDNEFGDTIYVPKDRLNTYILITRRYIQHVLYMSSLYKHVLDYERELEGIGTQAARGAYDEISVDEIRRYYSRGAW